METVAVCLEVGPEATGAFAPERPGCWVFGRTQQSALKRVRLAIFEWPEWLSSHGEAVPGIGNDGEAEITEMLRVDYNPAEARKPEPLFWSEVAPVTREDIDWTICLMGHSRSDLMATIGEIGEDRLDWEPPGEPRTIRDCLMHIAHVEQWYITRLNTDWPDELPASPVEFLGDSRRWAVERLNHLPASRMGGVFQPRKHRSPVCNLWTARKVLRRLVDHERLHTKYIQRVLEMH